jgi:hypothetical protein
LIADMEGLVEERCHIEIRSLGNFGNYFWCFIVITAFLWHSNQLSEIKQSQTFMQGFPQQFYNWILQHLQLKFPDHPINDYYCLEDICDAAQFILYGTLTYSTVSTLLRSTAPMNFSAPTYSMMHPSALASTYFVTHPSASIHSATPLLCFNFDQTTRTTSLNGHTASWTPCCNFCGSPDHFIRYVFLQCNRVYSTQTV